MQSFIKDLLNNPMKVSELSSMIQNVTANQMMFAKNMESHIGAIKSLGVEVKGLGKAISKVKKENNDLKLKLKHQTTLSKY